MKIFVATKAIILKNKKFLALKQNFNGIEYLDLPGGRMEYGLTPEENIIREVKEEVDLDIKVISLVGVYQFFRQDGDQVVCIVYLCKPSGKVKINKNPDSFENISWWGWVSWKEFIELDSAYYRGIEDMKNLVKKYFKES